MPENKSKYIRWFEETTIEDVPLVGGKNASLGEMYRELTSKWIKIPDSFSVTAEAYWRTLKEGWILEKLRETMERLDTSDISDLARWGKAAIDLTLGAGIPEDLWQEIKAAYDQLCKQYGEDTDLAARSLATAKALPAASLQTSRKLT